MTYELEIVACGVSIEPKEPETVHQIESDRCIFIVAANKEIGMGDVALTVKEEDKYAYTGRSYGIYEVNVAKWDGKKSDNHFQQWKWNIESNTLLALGHPGTNTVMFEGMNNNLATMGQSPSYAKRMKFLYNHETKYWSSVATGNLVGFD